MAPAYHTTYLSIKNDIPPEGGTTNSELRTFSEENEMKRFSLLTFCRIALACLFVFTIALAPGFENRTSGNSVLAQTGDGKLRIIAFGAHPDDCELQVGGVGSMWAAKGHHVRLVSVTNGD